MRSGANLSADKQEQLRKLNQEISMLQLTFGQNMLAETNAFQLVIDNKDDLAGLPQNEGWTRISTNIASDKLSDLNKLLADGKWTSDVCVHTKARLFLLDGSYRCHISVSDVLLKKGMK